MITLGHHQLLMNVQGDPPDPGPVAGDPTLAWSVHNGGSPVAESASVTLPGALTVGDYMVALVMSRQDISMPSGWNLQFTSDSVASEDQRIRVFTKVSTVSGAGQTVTVSNSSGADRLNLCIFGFTYTGEVLPYLSQTGTSTSSGAALVSPTNYTLLTTGCPVFAATTWARNSSGATTYTASGQFNGGTVVGIVGENGYASQNRSDVLGANGSRLGVEVKINPASVGYVVNQVTHDWFVGLSPKDFSSAYFLVTCGKT